MVVSDDRPFEWLTSAESLGPYLDELLRNDDHVLHVGCGSSTLGEFVAQNYAVQRVCNVDRDVETLERARERWNGTKNSIQVEFWRVDYAEEPVQYSGGELLDGSFDLIIDKSTMDCLLCSETASAGLLTEVYRLLKPGTGVYLLISFHDVGLLRPLIEDCPGTDWDVTHSVMLRQVEDLVSKTTRKHPAPILNNGTSRSAWSNGSFDPDENYRRTVNVLTCRRRPGPIQRLDRHLVYKHVNHTSDIWYQTQNPILTTERQVQLSKAFETSQSITLAQAYDVLFTKAELEHLTYDLFLEDWQVFLDNHTELPAEQLNYDTAMAFLREMQ